MANKHCGKHDVVIPENGECQWCEREKYIRENNDPQLAEAHLAGVRGLPKVNVPEDHFVPPTQSAGVAVSSHDAEAHRKIDELQAQLKNALDALAAKEKQPAA